MFKCALKFELAFITAMGGIGLGDDDITLFAQLLPESPIIELATIGFTGSVVDVLYIDKDSNFICDKVSPFRSSVYLASVNRGSGNTLL